MEEGGRTEIGWWLRKRCDDDCFFLNGENFTLMTNFFDFPVVFPFFDFPNNDSGVL